MILGQQEKYIINEVNDNFTASVFRQVITEQMGIATVSNNDLKVNDKKYVPKNVMSTTISCNVRKTKLLFAESLE